MASILLLFLGMVAIATSVPLSGSGDVPANDAGENKQAGELWDFSFSRSTSWEYLESLKNIRGCIPAPFWLFLCVQNIDKMAMKCYTIQYNKTQFVPGFF